MSEQPVESHPSGPSGHDDLVQREGVNAASEEVEAGDEVGDSRYGAERTADADPTQD